MKPIDANYNPPFNQPQAFLDYRRAVVLLWPESDRKAAYLRAIESAEESK